MNPTDRMRDALRDIECRAINALAHQTDDEDTNRANLVTVLVGIENRARSVIDSRPILDVCCGGRMMYFDKNDPRVIGQDIRVVPRRKIESNGSYFEVRPDVVGDFRNMSFPDNSFSLVVFDPPHLRCGETSFMFYKYGSLGAQWEDDLRNGFTECFRVLKPNGTLIFKWCDSYKSLSSVIALAPYKPVLSHRTVSRSGSKYTYFVVFVKNMIGGVP